MFVYHGHKMREFTLSAGVIGMFSRSRTHRENYTRVLAHQQGPGCLVSAAKGHRLYQVSPEEDLKCCAACSTRG